MTPAVSSEEAQPEVAHPVQPQDQQGPERHAEADRDRGQPAAALGHDHGGQDGADAGGDQQQPDPQGQLDRLEGQVGLAAGDGGGQGGGQGGGGQPGQAGRDRPGPAPPGAGVVALRLAHPLPGPVSWGRRSR